MQCGLWAPTQGFLYNREKKLDVAGRWNFRMDTDISQQSAFVIHLNYIQNSVPRRTN